MAYSDTARDHFLNPRNVGVIANASATGEAGSLATGDVFKLYLQINAQDVIEDARFQVYGSPASIAACSALTEMIKGRQIDEAARVTAAEIVKALDGLPAEKLSASVMCMEALEDAYTRFRHLGHADDEGVAGRVICRCYGVTQGRVERAIRDYNLASVVEVMNYTKAGGGCNACHPDIENLLSRARAERARAEEAERAKLAREVARAQPVAAAAGGISDLQRAALIQEVLDREVRPGLAMDGGDMELLGVEGHLVKVKLNGHCVSCSSSTATMRYFVEDKLRELVDPSIEVIDVTEHGEALHAPPMR